MRRLIVAPIFTDQAKTDSARLLYVILWTLGLAMTSITLLAISSLPVNAARWLFAVAAVDVTCVVVLAITRRGRVRLAGFLLVTLLWAFVTGMAFTGGGIRSATAPSYLIIILLAGLVLGEREGIIAGVACGVTALGLVFAEMAGVLPASTVHHTSMTLWLSGVLYAVCIVGLQYLASRAIKKTLQRARQDLAERERTSKAFQESQERFEREEFIAHCGSWDRDLLTNHMSWSDETFRILGLIPGSIVPQRRSFEERVHPEDRGRVAGNVRSSLADHEPYTVEYRVMRPDGNERIVLEQGVPQCDAGGRPVRLVGTLLDITEQRRAEENQQRAAEEIHDLYNHAPCGYHSLDANSIFIRVNDTELSWLGYSREEVIGKKTFDQLLTADSAEVYRANQAGLRERSRIRGLEFKMVRKDGSIMPVLLNATAVKDESGNFVMSRAMIFEITERHGTEQAQRLAEVGDWSRETARSILVVDDHAAVRSFAREVLEHAGHQIVEASDGPEALARLSEAAFDLLIADLYLPGERGGDLVRAAREKYPSLKVIVMSGAFEHVKVEPANALGANALLPKPITPATLVDTVQRVLEEKQVRRKTQGANQ